MIDWGQLRQLLSDIGPDDFSELVGVFLAEIDIAVGDLDQYGPLNAAELTSKLHFIKGGAANLGFSEFSKLCAQGEQLARSDTLGEFQVPALIKSYDESRAQFTSGLLDQLGVQL